MPIESNLSQAPYYDDFSDSKNYHRVLFKPAVAVQTRELNQLQAILHNQIEKFGNAVYRRGTIIQGCGFRFYNNYPYIKILDTQSDGSEIVPALYNGLFIKSSSNLQAYIVNYFDGFESSDPDLKSFYLYYTNAGDDGLTNAFSAGETLTIFDSNNSLVGVTVDNGSLGFSNTDTVVVTPTIAVNVSTGTWSNGDNITIPDTGANLEVVVADDTTLAANGQVLLYCRPRTADLANGQVNSTAWTLVQDADCKDPANSVICTIENIYGTAATANVTTLSNGKVANVNIVSRGNGYLYLPEVDIRSVNNSSGIAGLDLAARNYYAQPRVSSTVNAVGNGYAFSTSKGIIYQKGHFINAGEQTVIVSKYTTSPNAIAVGFLTQEEFVDSNIDTSLLDNSLGTENETAPGADRLKLTPYLVAYDYANTEVEVPENFYALCEWSEGRPFKQNQYTDYSGLGDELARRQFDTTGNFVVDTFQVTTRSPDDPDREGQYYTAIVDPGQAYVSGRKVQTRRNYAIDVAKGIDTKIANNVISLNYGNYVRVKEVGGVFQYSTGDTVDLYNTARGFLSNTTAWEVGNTDPLGTKIGEARIRSLIQESGVAGEANTTYRLYMFDVSMNPGKDFAGTKAIHYNGTSYDGICDAVLELDPTTQANIAVLEGTNKNRLVFPAGVESLKNSNGTYYIYRTIDQTLEFANTGLLVKTVASDPDEFWPYAASADLTDSQLQELYVVPTQNTLVAYANADGTIEGNATSAVINGTSTDFITDFRVGDYVQVYDSGTNNDIRRVKSIISSNSMVVDSNLSFDYTGDAVYRVFPENVPIPFGNRDGISANVDVTRNILTLNLGITLGGTSNLDCTVGCNIQREGVTSTSKTATRNRYVKIRVANNTGGTAGPWSLGVPDAFRLRRVYTYTDSTVNTDSTDITVNFYIDNNQTPNYSDLSYLYLDPLYRQTIGSSDWLLCEFDYYLKSGAGYFDTVSYLNTANSEQIYELDSSSVANLTTSACSWEVPEIYTARDEYYDLQNQMDFRPSVSNTALPNTNVTNAPVNPPETKSFGDTGDPANDFKFPLPDAVMTTQIEQYLGRIDHICIAAEDGKIFILKGQPAADPRKRYEPNHPKDALKLQVLSVPPYPSITRFPSDSLGGLLSTGISNEKRLGIRVNTKTVIQMLSSEQMQLSQPMGYTMEDVGNLERRIRDLEYYVSLSVLETTITNKQIPSSVDRTLNRFKFGFIADDFETELYSDLDNPQYAADYEEQGDFSFGQFKSPMQPNQANTQKVDPLSKSTFSNSRITKKITRRIVPPKFDWMHKHYCDNFGYVHHPLLRQPHATDPVTLECVIGEATDAGNVAYYTVVEGHPQTRTDYISFGSQGGTAKLYFYNYGGGNSIEVYQGNNLVASTNNVSSELQTLTGADKVFLSTNAYAQTFYTYEQGGGAPDLSQDYVRVGSTDFVKYAGKLQWTYVPGSSAIRGQHTVRELGEASASVQTNHKIVVKKGTGSVYYRYMLGFPDFEGITNRIVEPCKAPNPAAYNGVMLVNVQGQWSCSKFFQGKAIHFDHIYVECRGLRPRTKHDFYLDNVLENDEVKQFGKNQGQSLITDQYGKLRFVYVIDETWLSKIRFDDGTYNVWQKKTAGGSTAYALFGSTGYSLFEVRGQNSSAKALVANRAPIKLLK